MFLLSSDLFFGYTHIHTQVITQPSVSLSYPLEHHDVLLVIPTKTTG